MSIYLDRFLNMPTQPIPDAVPSQAPDRHQLDRLLEMVNCLAAGRESALAVSGYLAGNGAPEELLATMGPIMLPEDADSHSFQIVGAALEQFESRKGTESGRHVMIGLSHFLSAHSPIPRTQDQTYQIALRLQRGEDIYR